MVDNRNILTLIKQAIEKGRTALDLSNNQLTSLPPEIAGLTNLDRLDLGKNRLTGLPPEIAKLTNLTYLDLSYNQLTNFPAEVIELTGLKYLDLDGNRLSGLPSEIARLTNLTYLKFGRNPLRGLPPEIARLTNLTTLFVQGCSLTILPPEITNITSLTALGLWDNRLTGLPPEIARLTNLQILVLDDNQLTGLPPEIAGLTNLKLLDLGNNGLTSLPPEILELISLNNLDLGNNGLTSLPPEIAGLTNLDRLNLGGNQLTSLPSEIARLTNLTYLDLRQNQLPIPPETLANPSDVKAIFAAIAGLLSGERLNEAKMLVVGDGKVGKSSVVEQLLYGTFNPHKETTLGVEINDEMKIVRSEVKGEGETVKLNIWDFGGQEIQHSTHQFFLTTRSLYVLVVDARKGDQLSNIEYWLKLIQSFGGDSPILIAINQIDQLKGQRPLNLDRKALQDKYNIREFIETSCATGQGIPNLKMAVAREVEQLKHVRDIWPREWLAIKRRLKDMQADYIPVERYLEICVEEELNDADLQRSLLGLLHDLGVVIRFPGETQVLNPRWVTQGVYGLLTSVQLVKTQGQLELKDVGTILAGLPNGQQRYPIHTHRRLINMMKHFELCFEFTDRPDHYLIPRHLHDNELDILWDDTDALKFQYHYLETLPDSIISRFIVRMNQYITKQYYWKNGVFLHSGENRAKVKADTVDRKILISVIGKEKTRRAFLAVIRSAFDEINSNFKIEIRQMIPLPGSPQVMVSYQDLLVHEEMNEPEILIPELRRKFPVRELLDGVEELSARMERRERDLKGGRSPQPMPEENQTKPHPPAPSQRNNPWLSGSFYLVSYVVVIATILIAVVVLNQYGISWTTGAVIPVILIGGLLTIGIVGANQLRNDERLSDESYVTLMIESYKRLPLLRGKSGPNNQLAGKQSED